MLQLSMIASSVLSVARDFSVIFNDISSCHYHFVCTSVISLTMPSHSNSETIIGSAH